MKYLFVSWYPLAATTFSLCNIPREAWLNCRIISLSLRNLESCKGPLKTLARSWDNVTNRMDRSSAPLTYVITPIPELSLIYFQYMDQLTNLHSLIYLNSFAIFKLTMKQFLDDYQVVNQSCVLDAELLTRKTDF